mgnify:CR=1 FL=1
MNNMKTFKFLTALFVTSILTACTMDAERPVNVQYIDKTDATWQQHLQKIQKIQSYQAKGQIGYISPTERFSSRFEWQYQNPKSYTLKLYSLISKSTLWIQMHQSGMTISDNNGNQQSAANAKQPAINADYQVGTNHLLGAFTYHVDGSQWTADYLTYHSNNSMPENILLKNDSTKQTLKIRVDEWIY